MPDVPGPVDDDGGGGGGGGSGGRRRPPSSGPRVAMVAMVAAGWSDGTWAVAPCRYGYADDKGAPGDETFGEGLDDGGRDAIGVPPSLTVAVAEAEEEEDEKRDLATGNTGGLGPALHFTYQVCPGLGLLGPGLSGVGTEGMGEDWR